MDSRESFTGPVNLGNPTEFTIRSLADMIIKMTSSKSKIIHLPLPQDDPRQRQPDISLAKKEFGWSPVVELETGLARTIDYFMKVLSSC
jgi:Nucleoside-diphosphate-sugar epimerases